MAKKNNQKTVKAGYVDGFVFVVPEKNITAYKKMCREANEVWMRHGALSYFECMGEDLNPPQDPKMKGMTFPKMTGQKKGETVWFSFITFRSKKDRDTVNAKVMKELGEKYEGKKEMKMPFDMKRMAYGGFKVVVGSN